jgi:nitroimidazol reductase NimA-like FMN-containing flavoprotein (pyridoxamine 5'-phosphate oxidase superfamily)
MFSTKQATPHSSVLTAGVVSVLACADDIAPGATPAVRAEDD